MLVSPLNLRKSTKVRCFRFTRERREPLFQKKREGMKSKERIERRKHKRFQAEEGAFVVVRPQFTKLGQIIDISRGGLAFRYTLTGGEMSGSVELDIFLTGDGFYLERVPFKTVSDLKMPKKLSPRSLPMRRCGVQFGDLTHFHISQLAHFIENHTVP
jgi:hypothetical protein